MATAEHRVADLDRRRLARLMASEETAFAARHPRSREAFDRARGSLLAGVPMNWMVKWASPFPLFVGRARGAHFECIDGHDYVDLCLGDTGAMAGHPTTADDVDGHTKAFSEAVEALFG